MLCYPKAYKYWFILRNTNKRTRRSIKKIAKIKKAKETYKHILFFPSRPIAEKGKKYLFELARKLENQSFGIIGPFLCKKDLPKNFIDTDWIQSDDLKYYYSLSDVTLNLSELPESFSQICLESAYCGTPVVAFKSGNIPYLSNEIENICVVDKNVIDIEQEIYKGIEMKKNATLKWKVKNVIEKKYGVEKIISNYIELYKCYMEG